MSILKINCVKRFFYQAIFLEQFWQGPTGAAALIDATMPKGPIANLGLKGNRLGDAGLDMIATAVEKGAILRQLDISSNGASPAAIADATTAWRTHRRDAILSFAA
mmetsp:Transcript_46420/g.108334  ORF Transcript_46420/g.108334 Transcript_46420/m.108334 type:complete len:106 (+) Transcript_46420:2012-2329(+)